MEVLDDTEAALQQDQRRLGLYFLLALEEIATPIDGGLELVADAQAGAAAGVAPWAIDALRRVDQLQAGAAERVFSLTGYLQAAVHEHESANLAAQ